MSWNLKSALGLAALLIGANACAQVTIYESEGFRGRAFTTAEQVDNFGDSGLNDRASSVVVERGNWEMCEDIRFRGRCVVLRPGRYASLQAMGMSNRVSSMRLLADQAHYDNEVPVPQAGAQITFYESEGFRGRAFTTAEQLDNFGSSGFNDRASSVVVERGNWEVCENIRFGGRCMVLRPGSYTSLAAMGMNDRLSSVRPLGDSAHYANEAPVPQAGAQVTFYESEGFRGRAVTTAEQLDNFGGSGFNDRASSVVVERGNWEVCENIRFGGRCMVLRPGSYTSLAAMGMNDRLSSVRPLGDSAHYANEAPVPQAGAQVTFYESEGFRGRAVTTAEQLDNFGGSGFNDRASSVIVERGNWEVCENIRFGGRCMVLRPGNYASLQAMGMNDQISSVRPVVYKTQYANEAPMPSAEPPYAYRRNPQEEIYQAEVTSVHAVMGPPQQRCWVEKQQVSESQRGNANIGGAILGAVIGGVLGHQVGDGRGKQLATAGGAVAGAVVGANVGRGGKAAVPEQDVQRCETSAQGGAPAYWDVGYEFRGTPHQVQMSSAPGTTIAVNRDGEPRP
ncbi:MAG: beta/gamma crystallin-related protein [Burkholderiales bacterium]